MEDAIIEEKQNLHQLTVSFSKKSWCTKITSTSTSRISSFVSDHKEADTKLVALVNAFKSSGNTLLVRSPSGDINILMLVLLHQFENKRLLIDNGNGNSGKIIDMSSSNLKQLKDKRWTTFMHLVEMIMFRVSSEKGRKSFGTC